MSNGRYKAIDFKDANDDELRARFRGEKLMVTTDVAKQGMYAGLAGADGEVERIVTWQNPDELEEFIEWVEGLGADKVEFVLEPSGTYGDPLRQKAGEAGWETYLVSPKRLHDAAEVFDGVPSLHDAKATTLLAKLHAEGLSQPWGVQEPEKRAVRARTDTMARYRDQKQQLVGKLEAQLARYWPEVDTLLDKDSATLLALLEQFGGPAGIADAPGRARRLMEDVSQGMLSEQKIREVLRSARKTTGQEMLSVEKEALAELARQLDRVRKKERAWRAKVEETADQIEEVASIGEVVGKPTAAVFRAHIGDFRAFDSPEALLKHVGLNLKERSSGKHQGQLKITKRGSSVARSYLYWATLRMIQSSQVFRAWHHRKIERDGGLRSKSIVALMRKLLKGLWHVARGETFKPRKLFDCERLGLAG